MAGEDDKTADELAKQVGDALDSMQQGGDRSSALEQVRSAEGELAKRAQADGPGSADAADQLTRVRQWQQAAGLPAAEAAGTKEAQTMSGAAGGGAVAAGEPHAFDIPTISYVHDEIAALNEARCKLAAYIRDSKVDPMSGDMQAKADYQGKKNELLVDMILAEEELLDSTAQHYVPYSPEDEATLDEGYGAIADLRGKFGTIAANDKQAAEHWKHLGHIETIHDGLQQGMHGDISDSDAFKLEKKVAGEMGRMDARTQTITKGQMIKEAETWTDKGAANKQIKKITAAEKQMSKASKTAKNVAKMGGKGEFGKAYAGFAAGMFRLLHQETQRALIKLDNENNALTGEVMAAREQLAAAHAKVIDRRQTAALAEINQRLEAAGQPPLELHTMSTETDVRTHLDGKLQEFHLADSVARNFGDEASKRTTGLPTSKLADFRKNHAKPFDSAAEAALLEWCDKHCPKEKKNNKKVLALVGGVVAGMIALIGGVALATGGEETTEIAIGDPPGDVPVEEDIEPPATEVPAATEVPTAIPTATTVPTPVPVMPVGTIGTGCGITFHSPPPGFPNSFSYVIVDGMLVAVQGVLPDGTLILDTPGADVPQIETPVVGGLFEGLMPISSMTNYEVSIVGFTSTLGEPVDIVAGPILIDVGPAEGPIGGCTPASELTDDERDAIAEDHLITPAVDPDADPTPDPAATPGSGAQPGPVIIVDDDDGAIPAPKDDLAPYREFLTRFDTAHREGNAEVLFDWLDPLTIDIYGAEQCAAYLEGVVGSIGDIRLLDGAPDSPWTFSDGPTSADVFGAWDLQVELSILGDPPTSTNMHLRDGPDGVTWFTDCGEPLP